MPRNTLSGVQNTEECRTSQPSLALSFIFIAPMMSTTSSSSSSTNRSSNSNWTLHRGENYSLKADFQSVSAARQVHLRLYLLPVEGGTLSSIRLPFFRKDLCRTPGTDLHCPLLPSHYSSFKLTVRIPAQTPPLQGRLRLLLLNERRRPPSLLHHAAQGGSS
ncbi:hypothetical protein TYRP_015485 [Tyrophagus putrescentiae]|nr:hypothetical protein TYRP_015485 [Tyrophagus putrescentiae]